MSGELAFVDTNVLVYMYDRQDPRRQDRAIELVSGLRRSRQLALSPQVLREFYVAATRKVGVAPEAALAAMRALATVVAVHEDTSLVVRGAELGRQLGLSFWDALIVAAAVRARAGLLYTEDMNAGQLVEGVRIVNPFAD